MVLSIGMIVKNEEKHLRECLDGLKPILEKVDSELIIVDTGSSDSTVDIAKEYTDKVLYFEWCNDFAAARNVSLDAASGEWYLFLDADEFFMETKEVIHFFNSGEYKNYNSATFIIKNYSDRVNNVYSEFYAPRMTMIKQDTHFIGLVHEYLSTYNHPIKFLEDTVDHVGYINTSGKENSRKKFERNSPLLLKELELHPDNTMLYLQLCEAYAAIDNGKALEYADMGIEVGLREQAYSTYGIYLRKTAILFNKKETEKALDTIEEYFSIEKGDAGIDLEFLGYKSFCLFKLGRYDEAIEVYRKYSDFYKEFKRGKHHTPDVMLISMTFADSGSFRVVIFNAVIACIKCRRFNTAREFLKSVPYQNMLSNTNYMFARIKQELVIMRGLDDFSGAVKLYSSLDKNCRQLFFTAMNSHISHETDGAKIAERLAGMKFPPDIALSFGIFAEAKKGLVAEAKRVENVRKLKEAIRRTPEMKPLVQAIVDEYKVLDGRTVGESEFEMLAKAAKKNIRMFIADGRNSDAERMLGEYEKLCPNDSELDEMKRDLGIKTELIISDI